MRSTNVSHVIVPLPGADVAVEQLGGKAANLLRLMDLGLPVPPSFVITADAYRAHVAHTDLHESIASACSASTSERGSRLAALRAAIMGAPLDEQLAAQITEAVRTLGAESLAVRSSATAEDGAGHSFAGQHDTVLGVASVEACGRAVRQCWASLWSERVAAYRAEHGLSNDVAMAVVVQRCVAAEVSGVLFTCDPVAARSDRVVIEAVFGLGEVLVSGRVTPARFVIDKNTLAVVEQHVAAQSFELVMDGAGGTRERAVTPERAQRPCLDAAQTRCLAELGVAIERVFGGPQDIEWAIADGEIFLLQARPVTTLRATDDPADRQVWANTNTGEILPDVLTPMTFSVVSRLVVVLVRVFISRLAFDLEGTPFLGLFAGRAYFNMSAIVAVLSRVPLLRVDAVGGFGGDPQLASALAQLTERDLPTANISRWRILARLPSTLVWFLRHLNVRGDSVLANLRAAIAALEQQDPTTMSDAAVVARLDHAFEDINLLLEGFTYAVMGLVCAAQLRVVCRRWLGDADGAIANRLLSGVGGLDSADAGLDLWRLAEAAYALPSAALAAGASFADVRATLADDDAGRAFLAQWDAFMAQHGHHTRVEVDVAVPRWREQPEYVFSLLRSCVADGSTSPVETHRRRSVERVALTRACERQLGAVRRRAFDWLLERAQRGMALRENVKSEAVRRIAVVRATLLEIGARLAARDAVAEPDDVFFFSLEEIAAVVGGAATGDARTRVVKRRVEYAENLALTPPAVIVGRFDPRRHAVRPPASIAATSVLRGLAVSPGVVTGRARVILRADSEERVLAGEILVAPFTDPGWTPYFLPAAAIVMDLGGALSHGSIVAREYGIPAVVNVGPATQIIKTGDLIEVDGHCGEVRLLDHADPA
jgi:pyruvate,water dikinase